MLILKSFLVLRVKGSLRKAPLDLTGLYLISLYLCADQNVNSHFTSALISLANLSIEPMSPGTNFQFIPTPSSAYRGMM